MGNYISPVIKEKRTRCTRGPVSLSRVSRVGHSLSFKKLWDAIVGTVSVIGAKALTEKNKGNVALPSLLIYRYSAKRYVREVVPEDPQSFIVQYQHSAFSDPQTGTCNRKKEKKRKD